MADQNEPQQNGADGAADEPCSVLPFLKWPGGKRWAAARIADIVDRHLTRRYYEPFLGGGAVFFHLRPAKATLGDINAELIAVYEAIRDRFLEVVAFLQMLPVTKHAYAEMRSLRPRSELDRAVRFLYLNRTAFAGMYRVNGAGEFNVPYGGGQRTPKTLWETTVLEDASEALKTATLRACDFALTMQHAGEGDVVYCDPTYTVAHNNNGFVRYNERNFSWADQQRLARASQAARARGALVIVSNAYHASVRGLYEGAQHRTLKRLSRVSAELKGRGEVSESLLILEP
jgi:DNA adenine methylase